MSWNRRNEEGLVTEVDDRVMLNGWSMPKHIFPEDVAVGQRYIVQTVRGSPPCAVFRATYYQSDEELEQQHQDYVSNWQKEKQATLEKHREEWTRREADLLPELRSRLENFREKSGGAFDVEGWGYELCVCELAQIYLNGLQRFGKIQEDEHVAAYGAEHGTSGSQHEYAKALAKVLLDRPEEVGQTISALAPLGSGPYYDAKKGE